MPFVRVKVTRVTWLELQKLINQLTIHPLSNLPCREYTLDKSITGHTHHLLLNGIKGVAGLWHLQTLEDVSPHPKGFFTSDWLVRRLSQYVTSAKSLVKVIVSTWLSLGGWCLLWKTIVFVFHLGWMISVGDSLFVQGWYIDMDCLIYSSFKSFV